MKYLVAALSCACLSLAHAGEPQSPQLSSPQTAGSLKNARVSVGKLPLSFEPNRGQTDSRVDFIARGQGYTLFLSPETATFSLTKDANRPAPGMGEQAVIRMNVLGAQPRAPLAGEDRLPGTANYLFDRGAGSPIVGLPTFAKTRAAQIYPDIDLLYYGTGGRLEYDFVVAPHADPRQIKLGFEGARPVIAANGDLVLRQDGDRQLGGDAEHAVRSCRR